MSHHGVELWESPWCGAVRVNIVWSCESHHGVETWQSPWCGDMTVTMVWRHDSHHGVEMWAWEEELYMRATTIKGRVHPLMTLGRVHPSVSHGIVHHLVSYGRTLPFGELWQSSPLGVLWQSASLGEWVMAECTISLVLDRAVYLDELWKWTSAYSLVSHVRQHLFISCQGSKWSI